jgi:zinc D-Ala-D-Ala carboxypeptidase
VGELVTAHVVASRGKRGQLSAHFGSSEFACPHCGAAVVVEHLVDVLERIRAHTNEPLHIVSGYRCPIHNVAVGGADDSQHMYGTAADISPGVPPAIAAHAGAIGIGTKDGLAIHVDVRPGRPVTWSYH